MSVAYLDGQNIFGGAISVMEQPTASDCQVNAFFGVNGVQALFGGTRGRTFFIKGVLGGPTQMSVQDSRDVIDSFDDGLFHVLVDTAGNGWQNVQYLSEFTWESDRYFYSFGVQAWVRPYKLIMHGRT